VRGRALGPGRLEKRGEQWVFIYTDETGERRRVSLSTDRRTAERARVELVQRRDLARAGLGSEAGQQLSLEEVARLYLEDLRPRVCARHYKNVSRRMERLLVALGGTRVRDLKPMHLVRIRNEAKAAGASNRTANLLVTTVQATLRWAVANEVVAHDPVAHVKGLPNTREHHAYRRRALTDAEIERFLAASREEDEQLGLASSTTRVPQTALWAFLLETGARWGEARTLTWADVDLGKRVIVLRAENTKSRKQRAIPLSEDLGQELVRLRALHEAVLGRLSNAQDAVFLSPDGVRWGSPTTNPMRILDRLLLRAGIRKVDAGGQKVDIHGLRTTCASRMARRGVSLAIVQRWLGHSDPKLTAQHYTDLGVEDLRAAVERAPVTEPERTKEAQ
jgi:integrase